MKNRISWLLVLPGCCAGIASAVPISRVAEEAIFVAPSSLASSEDLAIASWQRRARAPDASSAAFERLGWAFVAKARATHDDGYYSLALLTADALTARHGETQAEKFLRGHVLLNLHRFREAETLARALVSSRHEPRDQALLSDALLEQGRINEAVAACAKFIAAQPGFEGYARVAHLRWLTGDITGAQAAMTAALHASSPESEARAWATVRLADYELQRDRADRALALADAALRARPDYAAALLVRGQALLALDRPAEAVAPLHAAARQVPEPNYQWWLAEAQRVTGDDEAARATEAALHRHGSRADPRTYALFVATRSPDAANAVSLARREIATRADPLTLDALAWALFAAADFDGADEAMRRALAAGTRHPRLHLHAACIARALGRRDAAREWLALAAHASAALTPSERDRLATARAALADESDN